MAYLRRMMIVPSLVISLALANSTGAQQNSPSIEQAKKDGEVVWYGTLTGGAIVGNILKSFENKYPGIRVKYLRLGGASFVERIRSEARAGEISMGRRNIGIYPVLRAVQACDPGALCRAGYREHRDKASRSQRHLG